MDQVPRW